MHRNIRLLAWFNFFLDFRLYAPIAILYFAHVSGSYALGMSVFSVTMLAGALFEVPTGVLSDRMGRKGTLVAGAAASVVSVICYALAGHLDGIAYLVLLAGGISEGLARAFYSGNNAALLHDTLAETGQQAEYQEYFGRTSSMFHFALAISAVVGSVIAAVSYPVVMWLSVIPAVLGLAISTRFVEPHVHESAISSNIFAHLREALAQTWRRPRLRMLSAASIIGYAAGESGYQFRAAFIATLWPAWAIGVARMLSSLNAAIGFYFSGRIIRRFGEYRLLVWGISFSEILNLFCILVPTVISPALMSANSVFFGINSVGVGGLMQREFTDEQRATMGSINAFGGNLAFAVFSVILGAVADRFGIIAAMLFATLVASLAIPLYARALRPTVAQSPSPAAVIQK